MYYLSKGLLLKDNGDTGKIYTHGGILNVSRSELDVWKESRTKIVCADGSPAEKMIRQMVVSGLVDISDLDDEDKAKAELFFNSIPLINKNSTPAHVVTFAEVTVYNWILKAGIHLTTAELTYLLMKHIAPTPEITGKDNVQKLVSILYLNCSPIEKKHSLPSIVYGTTEYHETQKILFSLLEQNYIYLL